MTPLPPPSPEYKAHRRRLFIMLGIVGVCALTAFMMMFGYWSYHAPWMLAVVGLAVLGGFAAQGWMILRYIQTGKPK